MKRGVRVCKRNKFNNDRVNKGEEEGERRKEKGKEKEKRSNRKVPPHLTRIDKEPLDQSAFLH